VKLENKVKVASFHGKDSLLQLRLFVIDECSPNKHQAASQCSGAYEENESKAGNTG
jgi:hypothetical protein